MCKEWWNCGMQGDALGYDVLVIDAMHKANFASRLCHSCRPNCEAKYGVFSLVSPAFLLCHIYSRQY